MRADNSRHLVAAAHRRAEQTRHRAVAALRRMDATGKPITFDAVAREAGVSRSWLYAQPTCAPRSSGSASGTRPRRRRSVPQRQRATDTSLLRRLEAATDGSAGSKQTTSNSATRSPRPSANAGPSTPRPATGRDTPKTNPQTHRAVLTGGPCRPVDDTVHIASPQVKAMIKSRAQDNGR